MSVAGPSRRPPSCRRRKRLRPGVGWWGSPVRFIVDQGCGYPFLFRFVSFWLLFSGVWETLIFGTGDWFAFGEPFFCGLFTPTYPLPGHRLVPESHKPQGANFWKTYVWHKSSTQVAYVCNILEDVCLAICKQMYVWDKYYCCVAILKHVSMASKACHAYEIIRKVRYR